MKNKKYKQTIIPTVEDKQFEGLKLGQIKKFVRNYFNENIRNKTVKNKHKGITVMFTRKGLDHVIHARNAGYVKYKAIICLPKMVKNAVYLNFKDKDEDDVLDILGYLNFKCNVKVENRIQIFKIVIRLTNEGVFFYDHSVKVEK